MSITVHYIYRNNPGSVPFLNKKLKDFSRTFNDIFRIFQGLHSVKKKSLESMSFLVLPHQEEFFPKVFLCLLLFLCSSPQTIKLTLKFQDFQAPTAIVKDFQCPEFLFKT